MSLALNEQFLIPGECFGCGLSNPTGLHIRIYRDGERTDRLVQAVGIDELPEAYRRHFALG